MSYRRKGRSSSRQHGKRNFGRERALQHIEEAKQLSKELGGSDKDVKEYFFSLSAHTLQKILTEYGLRYGADKKAYAEFAFPLWKAGRREMSGLVAARIYDLLPPHMPLQDKYRLVDTLWQTYRLKSHKAIAVGPNATQEEVLQIVSNHLDSVVKAYVVPDPLRNRFHWLSSGDVSAFESLLNHFLMRDRELVLEGLALKLPIFFAQIRERPEMTQRLVQEVVVGGHRLQVVFTAHANGAQLCDPADANGTQTRSESNQGCSLILAVLVIFFCLMSVR